MTSLSPSLDSRDGSADAARLPGGPTFLVLAAWFALALVLGAAGAFAPVPGRPPLALMTAIVGPSLLFALVYVASRRARAFALGLDLRFLTALQSWRVLGVGFLFLYAHGLLPAQFAYPAGIGDLLVGLAAPFVLLAMIQGRMGWERQVLTLNLAGMLDFLVAVGTGVLSASGPLGLLAGEVTSDIMQALPLSLIPTFAVPLFIIMHIISFLQLAKLRGERA